MSTQPLPTTGYLTVYATAQVTTPETAAEGLFDRSGYVSNLNGAEPFEARNDVAPLFHARLPLTGDDRDALGEVVESLGAIGYDSGSTLYADDHVEHDLMTDESWAYALHTFVKTGDGVEADVDPRIFLA